MNQASTAELRAHVSKAKRALKRGLQEARIAVGKQDDRPHDHNGARTPCSLHTTRTVPCMR
ncbi:MAG: hypothetical protein LZF62_480297 [Nitrospira sp.]|nr:MAG: hypothetical protein LZF62_480297 [Nitrospira sp.]